MSQKSKDSVIPTKEIHKIKHTHGSLKSGETAGPSKRRRVLQTVITSTYSNDSNRPKITRVVTTSTPKPAESVYSIDYSPRSKFLRKLKQHGRVVKKSPRSQTASPSVRSHKTSVVTSHKSRRSSLTRKSRDVGTNPASSRSSSGVRRVSSKFKDKATSPASFRSSPRFRDVGTDPPSFRENNNVNKASVSAQPAVSQKEMPPSLSMHRSSTSCKCHQVDVDILLDLHVNERQGKETTDCPQQAMQELRDFRLAHWFDCHADPKKIQTLPNHSCKHQYVLNDRLLPQPTKSNKQGQSVCTKCGLPAFAAKNSKHQLILEENTDKKVTFDIPNPCKFGPILRTTVESRNKMSIPNAPTLSYVPHFPQRQSKPLTKQVKPQVQNNKKIVHTVNCKVCTGLPRI